MKRPVFICLVTGLLAGGCGNQPKSALPQEVAEPNQAKDSFKLDCKFEKPDTCVEAFAEAHEKYEDGIQAKFKGGVAIERGSHVKVTHPDIYTIVTEHPVYDADTENITLYVYNTDGPEAILQRYSLEQWDGNSWITFPFMDDLAFEDIAVIIPPGERIQVTIPTKIFKNKLQPGKYRIQHTVFPTLWTGFTLTDSAVVPQGSIPKNQPFDFYVTPGSEGAIYAELTNHTNLRVHPLCIPNMMDENRHLVHPLAPSGAREEYDWVSKYGELTKGESLRLCIPTQWKTEDLSPGWRNRSGQAEQLATGRYTLRMLLMVYIVAGFEVK